MADNSNATLFGKKNCLVGPSTHPNGIVSFSGRFHTFIIDFKSNGISRLFRIPMHEFSNEIYSFQEVLGNQVNCLEEQLLYAENIQEMACIADTFLLSFLNKHARNNVFADGISAASNSMTSQVNLLNVKYYARQTNMSIRNFQRKFKEQVGISPKLYTKNFRFNESLKQKIMHPEQSWTSIAYKCGYFDQMHLIKDFKAFTGFTPSDFFKHQHSQNIQMMPISRFTPLDFFRIQHNKQNAFNINGNRDKGHLQVNSKEPEERFGFMIRNDF